MSSLRTVIDVIGVILIVTQLSGGKLDPRAYQRLGEVVDQSKRWHLVVYVDINSCLTCSADLYSWRKFITVLQEQDLGAVSVFAPREDSADVYWAMKLEKISDTVLVLETEIVAALGWDESPLPLKVLLDSECRAAIEAVGAHNKKVAKQQISEMIEIVRSGR